MDAPLTPIKYLATISRDEQGMYQCLYCNFLVPYELYMISHLESDHASAVQTFETSEQYLSYYEAKESASQVGDGIANAEYYAHNAELACEEAERLLVDDVHKYAIRYSNKFTQKHKQAALEYAELSKNYADDAVDADESISLDAARRSRKHALRSQVAQEFTVDEASHTCQLADGVIPEWLNLV